jgi:hypothetical protein
MDLLAKALSSGQVVFVVGAGASISATKAEPCASWLGLVRAGVEYAHAINSTADDTWVALANQMLELAEQQDDPALFIQAASMVKVKIEAVSEVALAKWLETSVGGLRTRDRSAIRAIAQFPFPILTTNYDELIEEVTGRHAVTWKDVDAMKRLVAGRAPAVGHLHGLWSDPDSVIFSDADYARLLSSEGLVAIEQAIATLKTIIFVGVGQGAQDPNLLRLAEWQAQTFKATGVQHIYMCTAGELEKARLRFAPYAIEPVAYGTEHSQLPDFLDTLVGEVSGIAVSPDTGMALDFASESRSELEQLIVRESVIAEQCEAENPTFDEIVIPPVLLPVPHTDFVQSHLDDERETMARLDPLAEISGSELLIVAGEEGSGLSTAVKWLALKASTDLGTAVIHVEYSEVKGFQGALAEKVQHRAKELGLIHQKLDPLPVHVLAINDFKIGNTKATERSISALTHPQRILTVVGCRTGVEGDLAERLRALGASPRVVYVGGLGAPDIRRLAGLLAPSRARDLAERAIDHVVAENLPRTPFEVSLLLAVLRETDLIQRFGTTTDVLNEYVTTLLGRGDPLDDARQSMDSTGRELVLSRLAGAFAERNVGGLPESDAIANIETTLTSVAWGGSPSALLSHLTDLRVLRSASGQVFFSRTSYLNLFVAKRAMKDESLRALLLDRPLTFQDALQTYAALRHDDANLVGLSRQLLADSIPPATAGESILAARPKARPGASPFFKVIAPEDKSDELAPASSPDTDGAGAADTDDVFLLDDSEDTPFIEMDLAQMPELIRLVLSLDLASTIVRDTDQLEDLELKADTLRQVLVGWGAFMEYVSTSEEVRTAEYRLREQLIERSDASEEQRRAIDEFFEPWMRMLAGVVALSGMSSRLASQRLSATLKVICDGADASSDRRMTSAALLLTVIQRPEGWVATAARLARLLGNSVLVIDLILWWLYYGTYLADRLSEAEAAVVLDLCVELVESTTEFSSTAEKNEYVAAVKRTAKLRRKRALLEQGD